MLSGRLRLARGEYNRSVCQSVRTKSPRVLLGQLDSLFSKGRYCWNAGSVPHNDSGNGRAAYRLMSSGRSSSPE